MERKGEGIREYRDRGRKWKWDEWEMREGEGRKGRMGKGRKGGEFASP